MEKSNVKDLSRNFIREAMTMANKMLQVICQRVMHFSTIMRYYCKLIKIKLKELIIPISGKDAEQLETLQFEGKKTKMPFWKNKPFLILKKYLDCMT